MVDGGFLSLLPAKKLLGISRKKIKITSEVGRKPDYIISHTFDESLKDCKIKFMDRIDLDEALKLMKMGYDYMKTLLSTTDVVDSVR